MRCSVQAMFLSRRTTSLAQFDSAACLLCQWRTFTTSYRRLAAVKETTEPASAAPPPAPSTLDGAPRAHGKIVEDFTPKALNRPIGLPKPPKAGENTGIDGRTWKQRRDDFVNYDKHLVKRKQLTRKMATPYFREWSNMRLHKGKSFLAPPRLFKADRSLYFPNLCGKTLMKDKMLRHTTPVFQHKITVVSVYSSAWAENQAATFVSRHQNPDLHEVVKSSGGVAQLVQINMEENWMKAMIVRLFMPSLRKRLGIHNWGKYFLVQRGVTDDIRDAIGLLNSKVGYTYLLDGECKIRWAGSGPCQEDEKEGLVKGVKRLMEELATKGQTAGTKDLRSKQLVSALLPRKETTKDDLDKKRPRDTLITSRV